MKDAPQAWVSWRFPGYGRACITAATFLVPVAIYPGTPDPVMLIKISALFVLIVVASVFIITATLQDTDRWRLGPIGWAVVGYAIICFAATIFAIHPIASLIGTDRRYGGLIPQLMYAAVALLVIMAYQDRPCSLYRLGRSTAVAATLVGTYVLVQAAGLDPLVWLVNGQPSEFSVGTLGNSNFAGGYLAVALPLSIFVALSSQRYSLLAGLAVGIQALGLWFTHTRGGFISGLTGCLVLGALYRPRSRRWFGATSLTVGAALVGVVILIFWHPGSDNPRGPASLVRTSTLAFRWGYWESGLAMILDYPILGTGPDSFHASYGRYRDARGATNEPLTIVDKPHNVFLEKATDSGLLGVTAYVIVVGLAIKTGVQALRRGSVSRRLTAAYLASLVAYLVQSFFSIDVPPLAFMGWLLFGAVGALVGTTAVNQDPGQPSASPRVDSHNARTASLQVCVFFLGTLLVAVGVRPFRANVAARDGKLQTAMRLQPLDPVYKIRAGDLERARASGSSGPTEQLQHLLAAHQLYLAAHRLQPRDVSYLGTIAALNTYWAHVLDPSRFAVADRWWRRLLHENPRDLVLKDHYVAVRASMARRVASQERALRSASAPPAEWLGLARAYLALSDKDGAQRAASQAEITSRPAEGIGVP